MIFFSTTPDLMTPITFESTDIKHLEGKKYEVAGKLTIKDVTKDVVLHFIFHGIKTHPLNPKQLVAGFDTKLTIDRLQYNVGDGKFFQMGIVDKDVDIFVSMEILRDK